MRDAKRRWRRASPGARRRVAVAAGIIMLTGCSSAPEAAPVVITPTAGTSVGASVGDTAGPAGPSSGAAGTSAIVTSGPDDDPAPPGMTSSSAGTSSAEVTRDAPSETGASSSSSGSVTYVMPDQSSVTLASSAHVSISDQQADSKRGKQVIKAYRAALLTSDSAYAEPNRDWQAEARAVFEDPYLQRFLSDLDVMRNADLHREGHIEATGVLISIDRESAIIEACISTEHSDVLDSKGNSVAAGNSKGSYWRYVSLATLKFDGANWKLADSEDHRDQKC